MAEHKRAEEEIGMEIETLKAMVIGGGGDLQSKVHELENLSQHNRELQTKVSDFVYS